MSEEEKQIDEIPARELPLSTVDNTPPLLLDLPDGQQLVVGKLPDGIVIEIATWRGTGRPDSRTNRMMLGVSYDEDDVEENPRRSILKKVKRDVEPAAIEPVSEELVPVEQTVDEIFAESVVDEATEPLIEVVTEPEIAVVAEPEIAVEIAEEIIAEIAEEIIAEIAAAEVPVFAIPEPVETNRDMQDLFGARPRTQFDGDSRTQLIEHGHEIVRSSSKPTGKGFMNFKAFIKPISAVLATVLGIFLLVGPAGISFTLPDGGLRTSLSSAENALVIVKDSSSYEIGDTVVAKIQAEDDPYYFATIAAQSDTEYVLTENNLYHTASREEVKGKVVLVMPGIGFLLHKLGL